MPDLQWNKEFAMEQTGGDEELLVELLTLFADSSAADLNRLRQGISANDAEAVVRAAHSLKGASASLGIESIRELALSMERDARGGSIAVASEHCDAMAELLDAVRKL